MCRVKSEKWLTVFRMHYIVIYNRTRLVEKSREVLRKQLQIKSRAELRLAVMVANLRLS